MTWTLRPTIAGTSGKPRETTRELVGFHNPEQGKKMLLTQVGGKWRESELSFLPVCFFVLTGSQLMIWYILPMLPFDS